MKKTPLYEKHIEYGAKMVDFSGWSMPVQYSGIIEEHLAVRQKAGLFDVSHMGELLLEGKGAGEFVRYIITNDIDRVKEGRAVYSPMCYSDGGTVDDVLVYKLSEEKFLLVVNAANVEKDYEWIKQQLVENVRLVNMSDSYSQLAVQGPFAVDIIRELCDKSPDEIKFFNFRQDIKVGGFEAILSRTGYTGEDGFEIYTSNQAAPFLWDRIMEAGREYGLMPAGLGARDTLRMEACLPLYGHELDKDISPLEAGLERFIKLDKPDFLGRDALMAQHREGLKRRVYAFQMQDRGVPRHGYEVYIDSNKTGYVTSGSYAPSLEGNYGMAVISHKGIEAGTEIYISVRGHMLKALVTDKPLYKKNIKGKVKLTIN